MILSRRFEEFYCLFILRIELIYFSMVQKTESVWTAGVGYLVEISGEDD